jgi:hypothetical protein
MPARKPRTAVVQLAKHGAELRLRELMHEARQLLRLFPDLRDSFDPDELPLSFILASARPARKPSPPKARKRRRSAPKA